MKTTKIYAILSLLLVVSSLTTLFANTSGELIIKSQISRGITHQVNVYLSTEKTICNTYLVEVRDGAGQLVAPAQVYVSGVTSYRFYERGPASGVRVASLVLMHYGKHYVCDVELFTKAVKLTGSFLNGQTYRYDLFPSALPFKE